MTTFDDVYPISTRKRTNMITIKENSSDRFSLQFLFREAKVLSGTKKAIILLHGVGRNEYDMFSLANQLPDDFLIISPRANFVIANGKYAWYVVDFSTGKPIFNTEQETESREDITKFVKQVKQIFDINEIYLGGFSQGAIMSYSIGLTNPKLLKGIVALSGRILAEIRPSIIMNADLQNLKIFVGHGLLDKTLPIHFAKEAFAYLENSGVQLSYHEYNMGHQITGAVIQDLNAWFAK